jgi:basic membrane protein A
MTAKPRIVFALLAAATIVAGCSSTAASPTPTATPTTPPATPTPVASTVATPGSSASASSTLKIGVVTDVGSIDDKNFNQYSYAGAAQAATELGAPPAQYVVPKDASDYATDIQGFVSQNYNIIVTVGFNLGDATIKAAKANPNIWFIAVDVAPCVDETGAPDSTFACKGDAATLLPHLIGIQFQEDQAGYLAGIVAAAVSKTGKIGMIGGINNNPAVVRYMQGFQLGAASYKPSITVKSAFYSTSDTQKAYADPTWGKTFGTQFISQQGVDVLFPVAGATGNASLDAACTAGIVAVGVDVDEYQSYPSADKCLITSAEKHLTTAVDSTIKNIAAGTAKGGIAKFDATNDGIGYSPLNENATLFSTIPSDVQGKLDAALAAMKAGTLKTCPDKCGTWTGQ